jgi:hypothetical protein
MKKRMVSFAGLILVLSTLVFCSTPAVNKAQAYGPHPRIMKAIAMLRDTRSVLEQASPVFGGHKAMAIKRVDEAMHQLRLALKYAR